MSSSKLAIWDDPEFSFQESYDTLNLLDSYINYRYNDGFQLQLGRYKSPYTYEWYRVHIWDLLAPQRAGALASDCSRMATAARSSTGRARIASMPTRPRC